MDSRTHSFLFPSRLLDALKEVDPTEKKSPIGTFQERFRRDLPLKDRGVHSANFFVLRRAKMPAILLETGFISNPEEEARLRRSDFRAAVVDAIARGFS